MSEGEHASDGGEPSAAPPELTEAGPEERIAALASERDELRDRLLRLAAEFENWKRRVRKESADAAAEARAQILGDMLDVVDNLERALAVDTTSPGGPETSGPVRSGVELVLNLLRKKLERHGVTPIEAQGRPFDPHVHEAISTVESADTPPGMVVAELQKGFRIGDRLLRPARVAVSAAETKKEDSNADGQPGSR